MAPLAAEYLSSSSLTVYPFKELPDVPFCIYRLFCDAVVTLPRGGGLASVSNVEVSGAGMSFLFRVGDVVEEKIVKEHPGHYFVSRHSSGSSIVVDVDHLKDSEEFLSSGKFDLCESCFNLVSSSVEEFSIWNSVDGRAFPTVTVDGIHGDVSFLAGTNAIVYVSDSGLTLGASPGAGEGVVKCECDEVVSDESSGTIVPSQTGDVVIEGDGCIQVSPDGSGSITIGGRCTACCPTDRYVEKLDELAEENIRLTEAYDKAMALVETYNLEASLFNATLKEPSEDELSLSITALPPAPREKADDWDNEAILGRHSKIYASANVVNGSQKKVSVTLSKPACEGMVLESASVSLSADAAGDDPVEKDVVKLGEPFELPSGASASVYGILCKPGVAKAMDEGSYIVTIKAMFAWQGLERVGDELVPKDRTVEKTASVEVVFVRG